MNDLRFALRQLQKSPGFTTIAVLTLALGIGANTAIFSVINTVLLQPLPYPQAERMVVLSEMNKKAGPQSSFSLSLPDYLDWRRDNTVFEHLAISRLDSVNLSGIPGRSAERVSVAFVTANFFQVIGLPAELGRTFTEDEDKAGGPSLVVISDRLWQRAFQRDRGVIGRAVNFQQRLFTVVGVMPPSMNSPQGVDVWFPIMRRAQNAAWQDRKNHPMLVGWGRLKPGVTLEQARNEMSALAVRIEKQYPDVNENVTALLTPLLENLVGKYRTNLALLLGAVALVLLIACANLANLFAARGATRAREFAIRTAVGASRIQIIRQLLIESLFISLLGGGVGFIFAFWGRDLLALLAPQDIDRFQQVHFDARVLLFTFVLTSFTSVLFGLWPAWQSSRPDVQLALKAGAHGSSESRATRRTRDWLVIIDVALTLVLLSSAGLVLKSFARLQSVSLGFEPRNLISARIDLPFTIYQGAAKISTFTQVLMDKVSALPGVKTAAIGATPPLFTGWQVNFVPEGRPIPPPSQQPDAGTEVVAGDYFATLGATLLRGRAFDKRDSKDSPLVVIIDQTLAEQYFPPGVDPIGKRLLAAPFSEGDESRWFEIVGVVSRMKFRGYDDPAPMPLMFFPNTQVDRTGLVLFARTSMSVNAFEKSLREIVSGIDARQPVYDVRTMASRVAQTWATQRLLAFLLLVFAGLALLLATVGLYGVLSYNAVRRLREFALRLALGATANQIRGLVFSHGIRLLALGCMLGLIGIIFSSGAIRSVLFQVTPSEPLIYLLVAAVLCLATVVACWFPAQRAIRVDPIETLRAE